jgi:hypothetical protein
MVETTRSLSKMRKKIQSLCVKLICSLRLNILKTYSSLKFSDRSLI